jgi:anaerobic magnesium-protoporphyrin IX monomethyl ester cyclase
MRVVLLRPPRYLWPFNSETSAFWQPLGLICLAAAARRELPDLQIEVWDAPGTHCGWRTLEQRLAAAPIDVLGLGEEAVSAHEALRAAALVKRLHPACLVVVGGVYFSHTVSPTLQDPAIDVVIRGEGERTFVEWLARLHTPQLWHTIPGLAFRAAAGQIVTTPSRRLIEDLDTLPFPAYDLLNMPAYGRNSRNHPGLTSIEHSRGCTDSCSFCVLWRQMGQPVNGNGIVRPCYRTKSAARSFDEVRRLYREHGRRTFGWVDPTFNVSPEWSGQWADLMLASDLVDARGRPRTLHTAWVRADGIVRDHRLGILDKLVRAGLRQVMIGVERDDPAGIEYLGKHHNDPALVAEAFAILRRHYPQVYTIGSMIFGLPGDTLADLRRLSRGQFRFGMNYCFLIPLTPSPGTAFATCAASTTQVRRGDLARHDFHSAILPTKTLGVPALESIYWRMMFDAHWPRLRHWCRQIFLERDPRKRRLDRSLLRHGLKIFARNVLRTLHPRSDTTSSSYSRRPSWYDQ